MSSIKPRVKVPKEVSIDEVVEIKTLIRHPMHSGRMKDPEGQIIPRQIINSFIAKFNGTNFLLLSNPNVYKFKANGFCILVSNKSDCIIWSSGTIYAFDTLPNLDGIE